MNYDPEDLKRMEAFHTFCDLRETVLERKLEVLKKELDEGYLPTPIEKMHKIETAIRHLHNVSRSYREYLQHKDQGESVIQETPIPGLDEREWDKIKIKF